MVFNEPSTGNLSHLEQYAEVEDPDYLAQEPTRRLTYEKEIERIEALASGRTLLDVGCYTGFFLKQARERGWKVQGVELSRWAAEHARSQLGLEIFCGPIEQFSSAQPINVVTLWDVLEHLSDPVATLRSIRAVLKPRGLLVFTTHNLDAPIARLMRSKYPFFMEMHTVHLNNRTRDLLLEKSGFELVETHRHVRAVHMGYLISRLERFLPASVGRLVRAAEILGVSEKVVWIGFMGLETVIARARVDV